MRRSSVPSQDGLGPGGRVSLLKLPGRPRPRVAPWRTDTGGGTEAPQRVADLPQLPAAMSQDRRASFRGSHGDFARAFLPLLIVRHATAGSRTLSWSDRRMFSPADELCAGQNETARHSVTAPRRGGRSKAGPSISRPRRCWCCVMAAAATAPACICSKKTSRSWRTGSAGALAVHLHLRASQVDAEEPQLAFEVSNPVNSFRQVDNAHAVKIVDQLHR
jgi:hypothetical protein